MNVGIIGMALGLWAGLPPGQLDQEPIATDRPDFTESARVVLPGMVQIESGFTYIRADAALRAFSGPEVLFRIGATDRLEVRLGLPNYQWIGGDASAQGWDDTYLGAKIQLGPTRGGLDVALIPAVFVPTGRRGIRSEALSPELKLVWGTGIGNDLSLTGMAYIASVEEDGERRAPFQHTVSLGIPVADRVGMFVEHVLDTVDGARPAHTLHSGFTYQPKPDRQFDIHYGVGLNSAAPRFFIGAGYAVRF